MGDNAFFGGAAWARWLPPSMASVGEDELFSRCWELLVLDARGAARLAEAGRLPLCRTVLLPQETAGGALRARQVVDCGLSRRCSLTLSSLSQRGVLCVQRQLTAPDGRLIEPQEIPLPAAWCRYETEPLLLLAGTYLLLGGLE